MKLLRPTRPIILPSRLSWNSLFPYRHYHTMSETLRNPSTTDKKNYDKKPRGNFKNRPPKDKKPPLTHFLCLPLVNSISLPQLESSLATFKAAIPVSPASSLSTLREGGQNNAQAEVIVNEQKPLIPDGALRPAGTLHLTLGVMSLPTKERLDEALGFFQSLDLAGMLHEAGDKAQQSRSRHNALEQVVSSTDKPGNDTAAATSAVSRPPPQPFNISLESLHALPRARSATVLHAAPVDPTSRLYPFCEMLRDKFLEAGFLLGENKSPPQQGQADEDHQGGATEGVSQQGEGSRKDIENDGGQPAAENNSISSNTDTPIDTKLLLSSILKELPINIAEEPPTQPQPQPKPTTKPIHILHKPKSKPRPLLLHATVVNTIYIKGRQRNAGRGGKGNNNENNNTRYTFDARYMLDHYRDYYLDSHRTTPRSAAVTVAGARARDTPIPLEDIDTDTLQRHSNEGGTENDEDPEQKKKTSSRSGDDNNDRRTAALAAKKPFLWARDFPLESVCICEMGAKKLDPNGGGLNARLGEKYRAVAEKSIYGDDSSATNPPVPEHGSSDGSLEGGVNVSG